MYVIFSRTLLLFYILGWSIWWLLGLFGCSTSYIWCCMFFSFRCWHIIDLPLFAIIILLEMFMWCLCFESLVDGDDSCCNNVCLLFYNWILDYLFNWYVLASLLSPYYVGTILSYVIFSTAGVLTCFWQPHASGYPCVASYETPSAAMECAVVFSSWCNYFFLGWLEDCCSFVPWHGCICHLLK